MRKKLLIFIVGLALSITLRPIPIIGQQSAGPPSDSTQSNPPSPKQGINNQSQSPKNAETGTNKVYDGQLPITITIGDQVTIHVVGTPKTIDIEKNSTQQPKPWWKNPDWWVVNTAGIAAIFAFCAFWASKRQADTAQKQLALASNPRLYIDGVRVSGLAVGGGGEQYSLSRL